MLVKLCLRACMSSLGESRKKSILVRVTVFRFATWYFWNKSSKRTFPLVLQSPGTQNPFAADGITVYCVIPVRREKTHLHTPAQVPRVTSGYKNAATSFSSVVVFVPILSHCLLRVANRSIRNKKCHSDVLRCIFYAHTFPCLLLLMLLRVISLDPKQSVLIAQGKQWLFDFSIRRSLTSTRQCEDEAGRSGRAQSKVFSNRILLKSSSWLNGYPTVFACTH